MNTLVQIAWNKLVNPTDKTNEFLRKTFSTTGLQSLIKSYRDFYGPPEFHKGITRTFCSKYSSLEVSACRFCGHSSLTGFNKINIVSNTCPCCKNSATNWYKIKFEGIPMSVPHHLRFCKNKPEDCKTAYSFKLSSIALNYFSKDHSRTAVIKAFIDARNNLEYAKSLLNGYEPPPWTIWVGTITTIEKTDVLDESVALLINKKTFDDEQNFNEWTSEDIQQWFKDQGPPLDQYAEKFEFTPSVHDLFKFKEEDFTKYFNIRSVHIPILLQKIKDLQNLTSKHYAPLGRTPTLEELREINRQFLIEPEEINLSEKTGEGSFSEVTSGFIVGKMTPFCTSIACKMIKNIRHPKILEIVHREISIISKFNHKNILRFYGFSIIQYKYEKTLVLVTEYMEVGSLNQKKILNLVQKDNNILYKIALDIAEGMKFLHEQFVIHRDLKPDNILLTGHKSNLTAKVADFGLSRKINNENMSSTMGAEKWMAPEVLEGNKYSLASDVYSFGLILWFLIQGDYPYKDFDLENDFREKIISGERPFIPETWHYVQVELVTKCWQQKPEERLTFSAIVEVLTEIRDQYYNYDTIAKFSN